jgi:hypothetical protein
MAPEYLTNIHKQVMAPECLTNIHKHVMAPEYLTNIHKQDNCSVIPHGRTTSNITLAHNKAMGMPRSNWKTIQETKVI